jgi:hypothetical protein
LLINICSCSSHFPLPCRPASGSTAHSADSASPCPPTSPVHCPSVTEAAPPPPHHPLPVHQSPPLPRTLYTRSFSPSPPPPIAQNSNLTPGAAATIPINLLPHVARTGPSLRYGGRLVGPPSFGHGLMDSDTITSRERTTVQGRRRANEPGHVRSRTNDVGVL